MNIDYILQKFHITEAEFENELRGMYSTSFFHIYTSGEYLEDLNQLSVKDRGTFIHEYIHYWQNIGTLWGLGNSILFYNEIRHIVNEIRRSEEIKLPLNISFPKKYANERLKYEIGNGTNKDEIFKSKSIDLSKHMAISFVDKPIGTGSMPAVYIKVYFTDGNAVDISLGAHIIKESMAALYQSLIDPETPHDDIPYNLVRLLCKKNFPELADNIQLLICACYASLFSMRPGETLLQLLAFATKEKISNGIDLLSYHISNSTVMTSKHSKPISITQCFDEMVDCFLQNLRDNLIAPLDYIEEAMNRMRISTGWLPLITVLNEDKRNMNDNLNHIIGYMGIPYIQAKNGIYHASTVQKKEQEQLNEASLDVLELNAQEAVFLYLMGKTPFRCCPLYYMCQGGEFEKVECFDAPWEGNECGFTIAGHFLKEKKIFWE